MIESLKNDLTKLAESIVIKQKDHT